MNGKQGNGGAHLGDNQGNQAQGGTQASGPGQGKQAQGGTQASGPGQGNQAQGKQTQAKQAQGGTQASGPGQGKQAQGGTQASGPGQGNQAQGNQTQGAKLAGGKQQADQDLAKDQKAGTAAPCCGKKQEDRWLKVRWDRDEVYCHDQANLIGEAKGIKKVVPATGTVKVQEKTQVGGKEQVTERGVATLKGKGQNSFKLPWQACGVAFKVGPDNKMPEQLPAPGTLSADGLTAKTPKALAVRRLPDREPEPVSFQCSSPKAVNGTADYAWTAAFKLGVKNAALLVKQTLQIKKAWQGRWVSFDAKADKLKQSWGFVKKAGADWQYWNTTDNKWDKLPRKVSDYTVNALLFVQSGKSFVSRDDGGKYTWPEAFAEPADYEQKKTAWLKNIHDVWDNQFRIRHQQCKGSAAGFCEWDVTVRVNWSDAAGDKLVYAVWSDDWGRSNAQDWYLSETRLGVAGHECGHLLGAYDEYTGGAIHPTTKKIAKDSIMGQNLTTAKPRHLEDLKKQAQQKIKAWIGRDWPLEVKKK